MCVSSIAQPKLDRITSVKVLPLFHEAEANYTRDITRTDRFRKMKKQTTSLNCTQDDEHNAAHTKDQCAVISAYIILLQSDKADNNRSIIKTRECNERVSFHHVGH